MHWNYSLDIQLNYLGPVSRSIDWLLLIFLHPEFPLGCMGVGYASLAGGLILVEPEWWATLCFWNGRQHSISTVYTPYWMHAQSLSHVQTLPHHGLQPARLLCPWNFSRQEYWNTRIPPPGDLSTQRLNPDLRCFLHWQTDSLPLSHLRSPTYCIY